jgi:hypothetical protein
MCCLLLAYDRFFAIDLVLTPKAWPFCGLCRVHTVPSLVSPRDCSNLPVVALASLSLAGAVLCEASHSVTCSCAIMFGGHTQPTC